MHKMTPAQWRALEWLEHFGPVEKLYPPIRSNTFDALQDLRLARCSLTGPMFYEATDAGCAALATRAEVAK